MNQQAVPGRRSTRPRTVTTLAAPAAAAPHNPSPASDLAGDQPASSEAPARAPASASNTRALWDRGQKLARICIKRFGDICDDLAADKVFDPAKLARAKRISKRANRISSALVQLITEDED